MRVLIPFDLRAVRFMICGLLPTHAKDLLGFLESSEYHVEVRECCERLNSRRDIWQALTHDFLLLDDLVETFRTTDAHLVVDRIALLRLMYDLFRNPEFPWTTHEARPPRSNEQLHMVRAEAPSFHAWQLYLEVKSVLQDLTAIPEIVATFDESRNVRPPWSQMRLVSALAYTSSSQVIPLLQDLLIQSKNERERLAIQLELLIFQPRFVSLPVLAEIELERNCVALLAFSIHEQAPQPTLLRYLVRESPCRERARMECLRRPSIRMLCRGTRDWAENLIHNLSNSEGCPT